MPIRILAHRGASRAAPENTLAAFAAALRAGADGIELDVRLSRDGVPVVIHDATLDRTTDGRGPVSDATAAELSARDAGSWFGPEFRSERVPVLSDVLQLFGRDLEFRVEIKHDTFRGARFTAQQVTDVIRRYHPDPAAVWISSFNPGVLAWCRRLAPEAGTARLFSPTASHRAARWHRGLGWMGVRAVDVPVAATVFRAGRDRIWESRLAVWRRRGFRLAAWTVDDPALLRPLKRLGFQWIITNNPEQLKNTCNS